MIDQGKSPAERAAIARAFAAGAFGPYDPNAEITKLLTQECPKVEPQLFNKDELTRSRFARGIGMTGALDTAKEWLLLLDAWPLAQRKHFRSFVSRVTDQVQFLRVLSQVSDVYKQSGDRAGADWMLGVNTGLAIGYLRRGDDATAEAEIDLWVRDTGWRPGVGDKTGELVDRKVTPQAEDTFMLHFGQGISDFFDKAISRTVHKPPTLDEFLADPAGWATSGASQVQPAIRAVSDTATMSLQKSKWTTAVAIPADKLREVMLSADIRQKLNAVIKREAGKLRWILSGDDKLYLCMSWISKFVEPVLMNHPFSTLFWNTAKRAEWTIMHIDMCKSGAFWFTPTDHSKFDHHFTRSMINRLVKAILSEARQTARRWNMLDSVFETVCDNIERSMRAPQTVTFTRVDGTVYNVPYQRGLLSGWRWTALLNTLGNYGIAWAVRQHAAIPRPWEIVCQGDDVSVAWQNVDSALRYIEGFEVLGFAVNPAKTFVSRTRDEFLRCVYTRAGRFGYPHRCAPSLLYRKPWSTSDPVGVERVRAISAGWAQLLSRLDIAAMLRSPSARERWLTRPSGPLSIIGSWLLKDLHGATRLPQQLLLSWLLTTRSLGGAGWASRCLGRTITSEPVEYTLQGRAETVSTSAPGFAGSYTTLAPDMWLSATRAFWSPFEISGAALAATVLPSPPPVLELQRVNHNYRLPNYTRTELAIFPEWRDDVPILGRLQVLEQIRGTKQMRHQLRIWFKNPDHLDHMLSRLGMRSFVKWLTGSIALQDDLVTSDPILYERDKDQMFKIYMNQTHFSLSEAVDFSIFFTNTILSDFDKMQYVITL